MEFLVLLAIVLYFIFVLAIGFYFYNKSHNMSDYVLGGREMNPYVTAMSAQASDMSGWLLMGLPGAIMVAGLGEIWIGIGLAIGSYLAWLFIAKRLRKYSEKCKNSLTVSEFFSNRFRDNSGFLKIFSAIVILFFFTIYVASGFVSGGKIFHLVLDDVSVNAAMIITALIIVAYTFTGGFKAVCWTDFFQAMLMIIAIVLVPLVCIGEVSGGWDGVVNLVNSEVLNYTNIMWGGEAPNPRAPITFIAFISLIAWGLGYVGMPHILVRYMAIENPEQVKVARRVGTLWVVIALIAVVFIAMIGRAYLTQIGVIDPSLGDYTFDPSNGGYNRENVFIDMVANLFNSGFALIIAGFLYAAILAAIMSTADSQLLVASSAITNDLYGKYAEKKEKKLSDNGLMWISRIAVVVVAIVGLAIALSGNNTIMGLVSFAWAGFGSCFGPIMVLALFWKRMNKNGAIAAMIVGFFTVILWNTFMISGGIFAGIIGSPTVIVDTGLYEMIPAFFLALITGIVVSLATAEPTEEMKIEFDEATAGKFW